jgi:hypothetical protein
MRFASVTLLLQCLCVPALAHGAPAVPAATPESIVQRSRVEPITPRSAPPKWLDYEKIRLGFSLLKKHQSYIQQILGTSSLSSTFAARDTTPVLMQTGRLPRDFARRMRETDELLRPILQRSDDKEKFVSTNLEAAYQLGRLHVNVAERVTTPLRWDPQERVPINQQSYALVLYSFAWWPIEALAATRQIVLTGDDPELEGWFHYWSAVGYAMGVSESLLPTSYDRVRSLLPLLKRAQYTEAGPDLPQGVSILLGGQVRWLAEMASQQPGAKKKPSEEWLKDSARSLAKVIGLSPRLTEALGLGADPAADLLKYAQTESK